MDYGRTTLGEVMGLVTKRGEGDVRASASLHLLGEPALVARELRSTQPGCVFSVPCVSGL